MIIVLFILLALLLFSSIKIEIDFSSDTKINPEDFYETTLSDFKKIEVEEEDDFDSLNDMGRTLKIKLEKLSLVNRQAVVLTKRPLVTAGVLHELTQIGEKPSGIIRENVLLKQEIISSLLWKTLE